MSGDTVRVSFEVPSPGAAKCVFVKDPVMPSGAMSEISIGELKSVSGLCVVVTSNVALSPGNNATNGGSTLTWNGATPVMVGIEPNDTALCSSALVMPGASTL